MESVHGWAEQDRHSQYLRHTQGKQWQDGYDTNTHPMLSVPSRSEARGARALQTDHCADTGGARALVLVMGQ